MGSGIEKCGVALQLACKNKSFSRQGKKRTVSEAVTM